MKPFASSASTPATLPIAGANISPKEIPTPSTADFNLNIEPCNVSSIIPAIASADPAAFSNSEVNGFI